jgi:hypothetical protein
LAVVAVIGAGTSGGSVSKTVEHFVSGRDFQLPSVIALTSAVWYVVFAVGVVAALLAARLWPARRTWIAGALVLLAAADMLHFAIGYQPMAPASKSIPPKTPAISFLQEHRDKGRIHGIAGALLNDWALTYGLRDIRGYDPPQPSVRYFRLWKEAEADQLDWTSFAMESLSPQALQVTSVLGARYVVTDPGVQLSADDGAPAKAMRVAYDGEDARVFSNARAAPRAMVASRVRAVPGEAEARAALTEPAFDPRSEAVVVEGEERVAAGLAGEGDGDAGGAAGTVAVVDRSNSAVDMRVRLPRRGLVVLNDSYAPGWSVHVDSREADPVLVNEVMRGVVVGAGAHDVEWRYRVPGLRAGVALSVLAFVLAGVLVWGPTLLSGRRRAV